MDLPPLARDRLHVTDVMLLTGKSQRSANYYIQAVRDALGLGRKPTLSEFLAYEGITREYAATILPQQPYQAKQIAEYIGAKMTEKA